MELGRYTFALICCFAMLALVSFHLPKNSIIENQQPTHRFSFGSPGGKTGAPGDETCTNCHLGTVQSGIGMNSVIISDQNGPVGSYTPGMDYEVTISLATNNGKNGFEIVPFSSSNVQAGTVYTLDNFTQLIDLGATSRITHDFSGNTLNSWTFGWTAPNSNVGDVTFYLATNLTNGNMAGDGDAIFTSQHVIGSTVGITDQKNKLGIQAFYDPSTTSISLTIDSKASGESALNIVGLDGKSVQFEKLGKVSVGENQKNINLNNGIPKGMYVLHVNVGNDFSTKKIYVY
jgi:hypothetical protein